MARDVEHYRLEVILAVGYRVRSNRGTQFRQWATARFSEYLVKGFTRLVDADFEAAVKQLKKLPAPHRKKKKS